MRVVFRCDASVEIGMGHVMRCLTLADLLKARGARVSFVCRPLPGNLCEFIEGRGYPVHRLEAPEGWQADAEATGKFVGSGRGGWLVVDHYGLDARYERRLRLWFEGILAIDDLADRPHEVDLLLDQNLYPDLERRYQGLLLPGCKKFLGPRFALLRPEFYAARRHLRTRDGIVRRMLLSFGGADHTDETGKALVALRSLDLHGMALDVVLGASNPHGETLKSEFGALPGCTFHRQVDNMAELIAVADLALGSGGSTTWERCLLGLPSLTVVVAENQLKTTEAVAAAGATVNLGWYQELSAAGIAAEVRPLLNDPPRLLEMTRNCFDLMGEPAEEHPLVAEMLPPT